MAGRDVLTTRIGDTVKVEIMDPNVPHGTVPNYGNVKPDGNRFVWHLASGQNGTGLTEQKAINAAARAIRAVAKRPHPGQMAVAHVPSAVVEAVNRVREHFTERIENEFYSPNGEAILHYRVDGATGKGTIHIVPNQASDTLVLIVHTVPGHVEAGVPEAFVSNPMYNTASTLDWWAPDAEPKCPACGEVIDGYPATSRFDNTTKICNGCGDAEAMGDWAGFKLLGPGKVDG